MWKNIEIITVDKAISILKKDGEETADKKLILLALTEAKQIELIKHLPNIMKLIYNVTKSLWGKISRKQLKEKTLHSYKQDDKRVYEEYIELFKSFEKAWKSCRNSLKKIKASSHEIELRSKKETITYNFKFLRHQLSYLWLNNHPELRFNNIPYIVCNNDVLMKTKLKKLNIKQVTLDKDIADQLSQECLLIDEVYNSWSTLNTAIDYLSTLSDVSSNKKLNKFLKELSLKTDCFPKAVKECCNVEHVEDLWSILDREHNKLLIDHQLFIVPDDAQLCQKCKEAIKKSVEQKAKVANEILIH
ncbi:DgyrCDS14485 [Dimorphilus gyrociliatus]|uniref:DgyrCDS14485 n=1 Tax=Dimorphilus gyrociliatus TaxID=2664684 RepID=A0A7I8WDT0_9ANNE|nr:DgyrCDS14485 [Dimorphilus gyrociliatus]